MLHDHMASGLQEGESQPEFRHPREDDTFIISPVVQVALPPLLDGTPGITAKMMWSVRSRDINRTFGSEPPVLLRGFAAVEGCGQRDGQSGGRQYVVSGRC